MILGVLGISILWYILYFIIQSPIIPSPLKTMQNMALKFPVLLKHLSASSLRILFALSISAVVGSCLGFLMAYNKIVRTLISPLIYIINPLPKVAFLPIFMVLFGLGEIPKVLVIVSVVIFQFTVSIFDSVLEIPRELYLSFQTMNPTKMQTFKHLLIPTVLPRLFTALRISFGVSISVLFFGETFNTQYGIGHYIMSRWDVVNYLDMYSGIALVGLFGLVVYFIMDATQYLCCRYLYVD